MFDEFRGRALPAVLLAGAGEGATAADLGNASVIGMLRQVGGLFCVDSLVRPATAKKIGDSEPLIGMSSDTLQQTRPVEWSRQ